jgi:hypothetical protein
LSIAQHTNKEEQKQKRISLPRWCLPQNTLKSSLFALKRTTKKFNWLALATKHMKERELICSKTHKTNIKKNITQ